MKVRVFIIRFLGLKISARFLINIILLNNPSGCVVMKRRKIYGQSRIDACPFCGKHAVTENPQGVPVCLAHKEKNLPDMKCICGEWLDVKKGKFGAYFHCMRCGNVSFSKAMEANPCLGKEEKQEKPEKEEKPEPTKKEENKQEKKEVFITSDDVDVYYS